jgi:hypothetical protein
LFSFFVNFAFQIKFLIYYTQRRLFKKTPRALTEAPDECETAGMIFGCGQTTAPDFVSSAVDYSKLKPAPVENLIEFTTYLQSIWIIK